MCIDFIVRNNNNNQARGQDAAQQHSGYLASAMVLGLILSTKQKKTRESGKY